MNTKIILSIALSISLQANAQVTFQKTFAGGGYTQGNCVHQTIDGGYIIAGYAEVLGAGIRDVYLIKTDATGDTLWTKTYGGTSYDEGFSVEQTSDSGYIITGYTQSFGTGSSYEVYLIKTNANGDTLWTKTYGGNLNGTGYSVKQSADGGYIIAGATVSAIGIHDVLIMKTDASGDTLWTRKLGGTGDDYGYSVTQAIGGGYVVAGNYSTNGVYLIKTDESGDTLWTRACIGEGPSHLNIGNAIQQTADSGFIIAGTAYGIGGMEGFLNKTNSNGIFQWSKTYSGANHVYTTSVQQTTDGGYILSGWSQAFPVGVYKSILIKTDANGDTLWTHTYSGGGSISSVQQTTDGGYVLLGADNFSIYLIKTDSLGNSGCSQGAAWPVVTIPATTFSTPLPVITSGGTVNTPATIVKGGGNLATLCLECNLTVSFSGLPSSECIDSASLNLVGSPLGGNFSGAGMNGNIFNPLDAGSGLHQIIYSYSISPNCSSADTQTIFVEICESVNNLNNESALVIYPNPADEFLVIKTSFPRNESVTVRFFDVAGREICTASCGYSSSSKTSNLKFETRSLENGIYFCQLKSNNKIFNQKFIVQH